VESALHGGMGRWCVRTGIEERGKAVSIWRVRIRTPFAPRPARADGLLLEERCNGKQRRANKTRGECKLEDVDGQQSLRWAWKLAARTRQASREAMQRCQFCIGRRRGSMSRCSTDRECLGDGTAGGRGEEE
jgi:hypothetical protein